MADGSQHAVTARTRSGSAVTALALLTMLLSVLLALVLYQQKEQAEAQVRLSQQYIVTALLRPAKEKLDQAALQVSQLNYGRAEDLVGDTVSMFESASLVLGQWGAREKFDRIGEQLKETKKAVHELSSDALQRIQAASGAVEIAEVNVARDSIVWAREEASGRHFAAAEAFLTQASTLFEDATKVEGMEAAPQDWKDDVIVSLARAQKSVGSMAETSVKELDSLAQAFEKVRWAKARQFFASAKEEVLHSDFGRAKKSLEEAATMFEDAGKVEGMEREDWTDDVIAGFGKVQGSVNDFAEVATPYIEKSMKRIHEKLSGK